MNKRTLKFLIAIAVIIVVSIGCAACNNAETVVEDIMVNVKFIDGGKILNSQKLYGGSLLSYTPRKEGYDFCGWYGDTDLTMKCEVVPETDSELYARWSVKTFVVKFVNDDGNAFLVDGKEFQIVKYGESARAPISPVGNFVKWNIDFSCVKSDLTVRPVFDKEETHTLTVFGVDGEEVLKADVRANEKILTYINSAEEKLTFKNGFSFGKWFLSENRTGNGVAVDENTVMGKRDVTYYAKAKLADITGVELIADKDKMVWAEDAEIRFEPTFDEYPESGVTYEYRWYKGDDTQHPIDGADTRVFRLKSVDVGEYKYTVKIIAKADGCKAVSETSQKVVTVIPAEITAFAEDTEVVYDGTPHMSKLVGATADDVVSYRLKGEPGFNNKEGYISAGKYETEMCIKRKNHNDKIVNAVLTIKKAPLNVIANSISAEYGDVMPDFTYKCDGFVAGENENVLTGDATYTCQAANTNNVGMFTIEIGGNIKADNYEINYCGGTLEIIPRKLTITAADVTARYGDAAPVSEFKVLYDRLIDGDTLDGDLTFATEYAVGSPVGIYAVKPQGLTSDNYNITYESGTLEIIPRKLTITAADVTARYGDAAPVSEFKVLCDGLIDGDTLDGELTFATEYAVGSPVGIYAVKPQGLTSDNYNITYESGKLTVLKRKIVLKAEDKSIYYGDVAPDFTASASGFVNGDDMSKIADIKYSAKYDSETSVGRYEIEIISATAANYDFNYISGELTVNPRETTVVWNGTDGKYVYDGTDQSAKITAVYATVNGGTQTADVVFDKPFVNAGAYTLCATIADGNYAVKVGTGKNEIVIIPKELTITAADVTARYGDAAPASEFKVLCDGLIDGDTLDGELTFATEYAVGSPVGIYAVKPQGLTSDNYNITYKNGKLTVGKRTVTIGGEKVSIASENVWSADISSGVLTVGGLAAGDAISGVIKTTDIEPREYSSRYDFKWSTATPLKITRGNEDYTDSYQVEYTLKVTLVENNINASGWNGAYDGENHRISVVAPNGVITYGTDGKNYSAENPEFKNVGEYKVYYKVTADGIDPFISSLAVIITQAELTITAADATARYGDAAPDFTYKCDGFVAGEDERVLTGEINLSARYEKGWNAGTYDITASGYTSENYNIIYKSGSLTVEKVNMTARVCDKTIYYGDSPVDFDAEYSGLLSGDTADVVSGIRFETGYKAGDNIGSYDVTAKDATATNYNITYESGKLTVLKRKIVLKAEDKSIYYGDAAPDLTANSDGFFKTDDISVIRSLEISTAYVRFNGVGSYEIDITSAAADNYELTFKKGYITVLKKKIDLTAEDKSIYYGDVAPDFTASASGFVNGDDMSKITDIKYSAKYDSETSVGRYEIEIISATAANYDFNYISGELTVNPRETAVMWSGTDGKYVYDGTDQSAKITAVYATVNGGTQTADVVFDKPFVNAGTYTLCATITDGNYALTNRSATAEIVKGSYVGITHRVLSGIYDPEQKLGDFTLDEHYRFKNANTVPDCATTLYAALYNADETNYNDFELYITINIEKKTVYAKYEADKVFEFKAENGVDNKIVIPLYYKNNKNVEKPASEVTAIYSNGNTFNNAGSFGTVVSINNPNYKMTPVTYFAKVKNVLIGSTYYTIEDALNVSKSGDLLVVTSNTAFCTGDVKAKLYPNDNYYTIKAGVELLVPFSNTHDRTQNLVAESGGTLGKTYSMLTVPGGITLNVFGTLNVNAQRGISSYRHGHTVGNYGRLQLDSGAVVELQNGAVLNSVGFVTGDGEINARSGAKVYDVLAIKDWQGGTISSTIYNNVFVFTQYLIQNIEAKLNIYYGAEYYARYYISTTFASPNDSMIVVGKGAVFQIDSGYICKYTDVTTGRTHIALYGGMSTNPAEIKAGGITVSTKNTEFPLPGNYALEIKTGSSATINNRFKLLPGAIFTIDNGATMTIGTNGKLYAYGHGVNYEALTNDGKVARPYGSSTATVESRIPISKYTINNDSVFTVNGTLNVQGTFGGFIETTSNTGVLNLQGTLSGTIKDAVAITDGITKKASYKDVRFTAKLYLDGDKTVEQDAQNGTYKANGDGTWNKSA